MMSLMKYFYVFSFVFLLFSCTSEKILLEGKRENAFELNGNDMSYKNYGQSARIDSAKSIKNCPLKDCNINNNPGNLKLTDKMKLLWKSSIGSGNGSKNVLLSPPLVAGNSVFTIDSKAVVKRLSLTDGNEIWEYDLRDNLDDEKAKSFKLLLSGYIGYDDKTIFAVTGFGEVAALDANNGEIKFRKNIGVPIRSAPVIYKDFVLFLTSDNSIYAVSKKNGSVKWVNSGLPTDVSVVFSAKPALYSNNVIVGFNSGEVQSMDLKQGNVYWNNEIKGKRSISSISNIKAITGGPIIEGGNVFVASNSGTTAAYNLSSGSLLWEADFGSLFTPLASGNAIILLTKNNSLVALNKDTGNKMWETFLPISVKIKGSDIKIKDFQAPILANSKILVLGDKIKLEFSAKDGKFLSKEKFLSSDIAVKPVIADNKLFIITKDGYLRVFK